MSELCAELGVDQSTFHDWQAAHQGPHRSKRPNGAIQIKSKRDALLNEPRAALVVIATPDAS